MTRVLLESVGDLRQFIDQRGPFDLAIWDFDGVVGDTEPMQARVYREMLAERGIAVDPDFFNDLAGHPEPEIWSALKERYGVEGDPDDLRDERIGRVGPALAQGIEPNWFVLPAVEALRETGAKSLVISSGNEEVVRRYLKTRGLGELFVEVSAVTGSAADIPKRERLCAAIKGTERALVVEDSIKYLRLAAELGAVTLGVQHSLNGELAGVADAVLRGDVEARE